jgi:hypothetical protein
MSVTHKRHQALDNRESITFVKYSEAFDHVDHSITVLRKTSALGPGRPSTSVKVDAFVLFKPPAVSDWINLKGGMP